MSWLLVFSLVAKPNLKSFSYIPEKMSSVKYDALKGGISMVQLIGETQTTDSCFKKRKNIIIFIVIIIMAVCILPLPFILKDKGTY